MVRDGDAWTRVIRNEMVEESFEEGDWRARLVDILTVKEREEKMRGEGRL